MIITVPFQIINYFISRYVLELLKKGWKHDLSENDLYALPKKCKSKVYGKQAITQWRKTPSLFKLLLHKFGSAYVIFCLAHIGWTEIRRYVGTDIFRYTLIF